MAEIIIKCAYCGKEFTGKNRKATYCCSSCRLMASRKRKREENKEYNKHKSKLEWEYSKLNDAKANFNEEVKAFQWQKTQFEQKQKEFNKLFEEYWPQILLLHDLKVENKYLKVEIETFRNKYYKSIGIDIPNKS